MRKSCIATIIAIAMIGLLTGCGEAKYVAKTPDGREIELDEDEAKELKELQDEFKKSLGVSDEVEDVDDESEDEESEEVKDDSETNDNVKESEEEEVESEETEENQAEVSDENEIVYEEFRDSLGEKLEYYTAGLGLYYDVYENGAIITEIDDEFAKIPETVKGQDGKEYTVVGFGNGDEVFRKYRSDERITFEIPSHIKYIGDSAFSGAYHITELIIPDTVEYIGGYHTFRGMENLEKIRFPEKIKTDMAWQETLSYTKLKNVSVPEGVYELYGALSGNAELESCDLPDNLKLVGWYTFWDCKSLQSVDIPDSVESIGQEAFYSTAIKEIKYPKSLKRLDISAFNGCPQLVEFIIPKVEEYDGNIHDMQIGDSCESIIYEKNVSWQDFGNGSVPKILYTPNLKKLVCPDGITDIEGINDYPDGQLTVYVDEDAVDYFSAKFPNVTFKAK